MFDIKKYHQDYYKSHKDHMQKTQRDWYARNKEKILAKAKAKREAVKASS